jgi:hypothetical protein
MDLLLIVTRIWRHKLITVPVILLTLAGAAYIAAVKKPVYKVSASYLLVNPPAPPTAQQIAADPKLGHVRADNPYTRFNNQPVMIDVLSRTLSTPTARQRLVTQGADPRYAVESATTFGFATPVLQITAAAGSPEVAIRSATLVSRASLSALDRIQEKAQVDPAYRITAQQLEPPTWPLPQASGQVRSLVAVLVVGVIVLFSAISVADAIVAIRRRRQTVRLFDDVADPDPDVVALDPDRDPPHPIAANGGGSTVPAGQ